MTPSKNTYVVTYALLLALSALTYALTFASLGAWGPVLALAIAAGKATLIALFFMHLVEQRASNAFVLGVSVLLLLFLLGLTAADVAARRGGPAPPGPRPLEPSTQREAPGDR